MFSFKTKSEYLEVKRDLETSFNRYSMPLKYCITNVKIDPSVLDHPARVPEKIEKLLGIHWNLIDDTITAIPKYKLHGTSRGKELGPLLRDMSDKEIMDLPITRMVFLRLSALSL